MADNYLESHYEEYLKRKAAWEREKRLGKLRKSTRPTKGTDGKREAEDNGGAGD